MSLGFWGDSAEDALEKGRTLVDPCDLLLVHFSSEGKYFGFLLLHQTLALTFVVLRASARNIGVQDAIFLSSFLALLAAVDLGLDLHPIDDVVSVYELANEVAGLDAIHDGHVDVQDDCVVVEPTFLLHGVECFEPVLREVDVEVLLEGLSQEVQQECAVVGHKQVGLVWVVPD